ncbi:hypothetical protein SAMN06264849_101277 [Melghirimyces algeriensis]|uniref:Uncharacterized protein n=1 Tax=Melghirimyces algeriensis TaxID=910412 RepID=A0A521AQ05_9BACL|nr:hypothetical protein SAMN06264849_101277 [Melghirimyces algeriensis]
MVCGEGTVGLMFGISGLVSSPFLLIAFLTSDTLSLSEVRKIFIAKTPVKNGGFGYISNVVVDFCFSLYRSNARSINLEMSWE